MLLLVGIVDQYLQLKLLMTIFKTVHVEISQIELCRIFVLVLDLLALSFESVNTNIWTILIAVRLSLIP